MPARPVKPASRPGGILARLARDTRGNAMMIMAAMLVPLAAFSGSAIDMARLYTVKTRLQQACDAGVLAGRRSMAPDNSIDTSNTGQAQTFFKNNFNTGWFKTTNISFTPSVTPDFQVQGSAQADVPMTIMKMFGQQTRTVFVTCQARYDVADTDIIFVLDTTGSMACLPADSESTCDNYVGGQTAQKYNRPADSDIGASSGSMNRSVAGYPNSVGFYVPEKSGSRISALRTAVINFYKTLASSVDPSTHVRYGFVTYTSTVNAGRAIMDMSPSYMVGGAGNALKQWNYQSRVATADYVVSSGKPVTQNAGSASACNAFAVARNPSTLYTYDTSNRATETKANYDSTKSPACTTTSYVYGPVWTYKPVAFDVSQFLTNASVKDPSRFDNATAQWQGCVEERNTTAGSMTFDVNNLPPDLDPDLVPTPTDSSGASSWRPMWQEVIYGRNYAGGQYFYNSTAATTTNDGPVVNDYKSAISYFNFPYDNSQSLYAGGVEPCGKPVRRLAVMSLNDVSNYVNASDFRAMGGTYHDTGMIWGVRMLSRNGIFASDNGSWPNRQPPNRVIVFLTDGDMAPTMYAYSMYGVEYFDKRVTGGDYSNQENYHNARFLAECAKAKAMNISVWTVSIAPSATSQMQQCATTSSQALFTTDGGDLSAKFSAIAKQVAMLRISQ